MVNLGDAITMLGLGTDILGAGILAIPDIPSLRTRTQQGKVEIALGLLEGQGLQPSHPGYDHVVNTLEELYGFEIEDDINGIQVGMRTLGRTPEHKVYIYRTAEDSYAPEQDLNWPQVRSEIAVRAIESEMRYRRIGLLLLVAGFSLQIVGVQL